MAAEVIMPKLGMSMVEGTVLRWRKQVGEQIAKGEVVVEISSEKIEMEVEASADGKLLAITVAEGEAVPYGTVLGYIGQDGEKIEAAPAAVAEPAKEQAATPPVTSEQATPATSAPAARGSHVKISPVAKKMAEEAGLSLDSLTGTGPQGRITKEDVEKALENRAAVAGEPPASGAGAPSAAGADALFDPGAVESSQVVGMRKVIAARMLDSLRQSAQLTMTAKADVTELLLWQQQLASELQKRQEGKLTLTDFIARAVVLSLKKHKQMNSAYLTDGAEARIETYGHVHLGIAVALEKGLVVPVIRYAERLSLLDLSKALKALSERARSQQLTGEEMKGSTFTISNLGQFGVEYFTPILNPPETGILGVGAVEAVPVYRGEELQRRSLLPLSLTFDHRVLDGAPAAQFLAGVKESLENPYSLLL
ncbi:dihydrolipoamide acetyltransferase family protein [Brevibacillus fulvus]|uniref:Dihydrolipoamide acetyltransferase component of pyruvate dehydrogenase complex n=1 Tax=Brevibacillus fulvus TaxID=1125967 RepID=A0A938XVW3_9BACL|nr:dihydrolipoamide acetyltransferase family protein [Brevibacillus fulvus]MBM7591127.1 pyruvate dehydrogenase E2 component (dihydrolipoamide acetyltransferase) [Brevibacillus fulvus]